MRVYCQNSLTGSGDSQQDELRQNRDDAPLLFSRQLQKEVCAMTKRIRRLLAGLTLAIAAATGTIAATGLPAAPPDTTWGSHATTDDTTWGVTAEADQDAVAGTVVTPLDTTWG